MNLDRPTLRVDADFVAGARDRYVATNAAALAWLLDRPALEGGFINAKQNGVTLADYTDADGFRGPRYIYGWIQGRALEMLVTQAAFFQRRAPELSRRADAAGRRLYKALCALQAQDGHVYFCHDGDRKPVYPDTDWVGHKQSRPSDVYTYTDAFVAKGLVAAASRYARDAVPGHLAYLAAVIGAIEQGRFQIAERTALSATVVAAQPDDFGPRMILLGAAGLLTRLGLREHTGWAESFIDHILTRHLDADTSLLRNVPGGDECNPGHGIEFVGFALDYLPVDADPTLVATLERILIASYSTGYIGPGVTASLSVGSGRPNSAICPYWPLPETIRSAALAHARTGSSQSLETWQAAHEAFFGSYWQGTPAIAYQAMTQEGPLDYVPATPELDPGYHTGLSLLAAILSANALLAHPNGDRSDPGRPRIETRDRHIV